MDEKKQQIIRAGSAVTFAEFWILVSEELSHARLHINRNSKSLDSFISKNSDVRTYLHEALKTTYKKSNCQHLKSPICMEGVLDTLGETAYRLQQENAGDLFDIELLEEIAWMICDRYPDQITQLVARTKTWQPGADRGDPERGIVVSFPDYKIRKANNSL